MHIALMEGHISGYIVDTNGNNTYLIHPERMALPTLYLSGGRTLLLIPQTSIQANSSQGYTSQDLGMKEWWLTGLGTRICEDSSNEVFPPHFIACCIGRKRKYSFIMFEIVLHDKWTNYIMNLSLPLSPSWNINPSVKSIV
ncbi:OLC1v1033505C1 [Oldenlandia corymbosa var. corymbosa]|uniref:OLC1v1033505C1 n=1 Tax=Oldenlandia corymbosa var. corymbosa TaxID=529605 RepID=A0AAV1CNF8_OLDCO|nr:OLC1v1033505C1 [Oldenlandia corymbosa var. corymbosa]